MRDRPAVGVVIPTYNRAELLRETLQSVVSQTVTPAEIVIVDDGSTDHTVQVVQEFAEGDVRVVLLAMPHTGRQANLRNAGVEATTTPVVAFLDSDDLWTPQRVEKQLAAWERAPEAGLALCNLQRFDKSGFIDGPWLPPSLRLDGDILGTLLEDTVAVASTIMFKRDAWNRVGGFRDLRTGEDYEWLLRMAVRYKASYVDEPLVLMREHTGRTSHTWSIWPLLDFVTIVQGFLDSHPDLPPSMRARGRKGMANVHYKLARHYIEVGDKNRATRHLWAMGKLKPLDRRAPAAWLQALKPSTHKGPPAGGLPAREQQRGEQQRGEQ